MKLSEKQIEAIKLKVLGMFTSSCGYTFDELLEMLEECPAPCLGNIVFDYKFEPWEPFERWTPKEFAGHLWCEFQTMCDFVKYMIEGNEK